MHLMQPAPKAPRTPGTGHDPHRTGARRSPKPSAQRGNRSSHQTQYPRFHEITHALGIVYEQYGREQAEVLVDSAIFSPCQGQTAEQVCT
jgi:hypothetical protein